MILLRPLRLLAFLWLLSGCAGLEPFSGVNETTPPPVKSGVWSEIEKIKRDNWQVPLNTGSEALEWRLRAIDSATSSIDLQSFIWKFDDVGSALQERLVAASERGIKVRILIDDSFLAGKDRHLIALHAHPNVEYRVYNPYKRRTNGAVSRFVLNLGDYERLDHRMHNKSMVVDNQIAIIGGRNLADEYFGFDDTYNFRDMELLVGGPIVEEISQSFDAYWNDKWSFPIDQISSIDATALESSEILSGVSKLSADFPVESENTRNSNWFELLEQAHEGTPMLIVDEPPAERPEAPEDRPTQVSDELMRLVRSAKSDITIVSAYLIPLPGFVDLLEDAEARGVRVRLLTNSINSNNHISAHAFYRAHVEQLLELGAEVHEVRVGADARPKYMLSPTYQKSLGLHAKYMIVDGRHVVVGSANLDPRSLRINTEFALFVESQSLAQELLLLTEPDFAEANAWRLSLSEDGKVLWISEDVILDAEPAQTGFQRLEEWFFAHLPIEAEM